MQLFPVFRSCRVFIFIFSLKIFFMKTSKRTITIYCFLLIALMMFTEFCQEAESAVWTTWTLQTYWWFKILWLERKYPAFRNKRKHEAKHMSPEPWDTPHGRWRAPLTALLDRVLPDYEKPEPSAPWLTHVCSDSNPPLMNNSSSSLADWCSPVQLQLSDASPQPRLNLPHSLD